jgi:hypothetical protein
MPAQFNFDASDKQVSEILFSNSYKFLVPRYQRPYEWKEDHVSEFWNDVFVTDAPFFLGSFILNHENYAESGYVEIIDGQQRILTMTIVAAVMRDIAKGIDNETAGRYHRQDIAFEERDGKYVFRVYCGDTIRDYFENSIQRIDNDIRKEVVPSDPEEKKVFDNYWFFYEKMLNELAKCESKEDKLKSLEKLRKRLAESIVIHIKIESDDAAYEIFETTNARGVDLSVADLVKNLVLKNIREKNDRDAAKDIWNQIVDNIQSTGTEMKRFIRYYWISKHNFVNDKQLYRTIKREIKEWEYFLQDIGTASEWFSMLVEGDERDWIGVKDGANLAKSLRALKIMNVTQCYVLFLAISRHFDKLGSWPKRIFRLIEDFQFNYSAVCGLPANRLERLYSSYAIELEKIMSEGDDKHLKGNIDRLFTKLESELKERRPLFELFEKNFMAISYNNSEGRRMFIKYIFDRVNSFMAGTNENIVNFASVNIEHILPQEPAKWGFKKSEIKDYVNLLGNLTIVDQQINSSMGNERLEVKLTELSKSKLPVTINLVHELEAKKSWDKSEIIERHSQLTYLAYTCMTKYLSRQGKIITQERSDESGRQTGKATTECIATGRNIG